MWMASKVATAVVFAALATAGAHAGDTAVTLPDWMRDAVAQKLPAYPTDTQAVIVWSDETDTVTAPDEHLEHYRRVVKILRPEGRNWGDLFVDIGKDEKLIAVHAWVVDPNNHQYELKPKDFIAVGSFGDALYSDISEERATAPAAIPGSVIGFEYEVKRRDYFNELQWQVQHKVPVHHASFTVQLPTGWELKESWSGTQPVKAAQSGGNGWQWTKDDLPGIDDEPYRPVDEALAARLTVALFTPTQRLGTDWDALANWASGLFRVQRSVTPEMSAKVQELTAGHSDFDGKVRSLTEFLQKDVRYVEISIGIGGYQPHAAADVFRARYGDCKDKANLLSTLLAQAGINSEMVLIHTERGVVRPETPGNYFNHAILAIELPAGVTGEQYSSVITAKKTGKRYVIFDPTDEWLPFGQVRAELQDSYGLMVSDSGGELIHVPIANPSTNEIIRSAKLKLSPDGAIDGDVEEKLTGDFAERMRMRAESANQQQQLQRYEDQIAHSVKNASVQGLMFSGLRDLKPSIDVHYSLAANRYAQITGPLLIVRPRVLGIKSIGLDRKPRKYPLLMGSTALETDDFEVELPAGYVVDDKPDPISVDTPFATYKSSLEISGSKLDYSREYVLKSLEIRPEEMEALRAFESKVAEDENSAVVLKKVADGVGR